MGMGKKSALSVLNRTHGPGCNSPVTTNAATRLGKRPQTPASGRLLVTFRMTTPEGWTVEAVALTRSEARAEFKRHFRHGKILPGTLIERV